jgi:hypothetical protein
MTEKKKPKYSTDRTRKKKKNKYEKREVITLNGLMEDFSN